ncbi:glycosyltransferase [Psychroflexus sediminis]|uniref:Glycosyltransferase, catalytic subunit of cellulose synthase and poly-beta-1,6-N-acetylglucosamine synthase n=1 Tax=Psychroflexus sediminis TaxID=470826 RepID=A0A1G7V4T0_9FLAO|nr:glycosyltransferase [Psychroflexus sediminis]SDG54766.1 Glycosyltransferase, catalytic subunit of cellulose synthase and poly-beta-1,6-N-acetylglucosamine synthase [Psychroflexus sediminis]
MKIILLLFLISTVYILIQQFKIVGLFSKHTSPPSPHKNTKTPVSIVICAKNEAENLSKNLKFVLNQKYFEFEVIIVDDFSTDLTSEIIKKYQENFANLKLIRPWENTSNSKRDALKTGVLASSFERILLTDADCRPVSENWISSMCAQLSPSTSCVLGYSPYLQHSSFLNFIIQFETLQTAGLYLSQAIDNKAYMGVGRNVMYTKNLFLDSENFENEKHLTSGDDDLLIQQISDKSTITVSLSSDSFVISQPKTSWRSWWKQKLRHYSTAPYYKPTNQLFLGLYHISHAVFWLTCVLLLFTHFSKIAAVILVIYVICKSLLIVNYGKTLKVSKSVLFIWPILEACLLCLQIGLGVNSRFKKQKSWQ